MGGCWDAQFFFPDLFVSSYTCFPPFWEDVFCAWQDLTWPDRCVALTPFEPYAVDLVRLLVKPAHIEVDDSRHALSANLLGAKDLICEDVILEDDAALPVKGCNMVTAKRNIHKLVLSSTLFILISLQMSSCYFGID